MKTKRSIILILVMLMLLPLVLAGCKGFWPLSRDMKEKVEELYKIPRGMEDLPDEVYYEKGYNIRWFDECGKRGPDVYRYFGTYGDCIVLLWYSGNKTPRKIYNLARVVEFPVECNIFLCNTNPDYPRVTYPGSEVWLSPFEVLDSVVDAGVTWLTDEELEQLTTDLENWRAVGNY